MRFLRALVACALAPWLLAFQVTILPGGTADTGSQAAPAPRDPHEPVPRPEVETGARDDAGLPSPVLLRVSSSADEGAGSLRAAIEAANVSSEPVRIQVDLDPGTVIQVGTGLPAITATGLLLDGGGATIVSSAGCTRADGRAGCDGLVVRGPNVTVRNLKTTGFMFDGIAVRGVRARNVRILQCESFGNQDDGIGISESALDVLVEGSAVAGNGFRTKGKGILVFDSASAVLRNNLVQGNRDGITVSRGARAVLEDNMILYNFDKGVGVIGATVEGRRNRIVGSGTPQPGRGPAPNADGLRVSLSSTVTLEETVVSGSYDNGVVVLDDSRVRLRGGRVERNQGVGAVVADRGELRIEAVGFGDNREGAWKVDGPGARLIR